LAVAVHLHNIVIDLVMLTEVGRRVTEIQSLDASLGIELGGAALALGIHRVVLLHLVVLFPLPLFFRFVVPV
jgi:hypothetical protein